MLRSLTTQNRAIWGSELPNEKNIANLVSGKFQHTRNAVERGCQRFQQFREWKDERETQKDIKME